MRIHVYRCEDAPAGQEFFARIWCDFDGSLVVDGRRRRGTVQAWHPVLIPGDDAEEVRQRASDWWALEVAKVEAREVSRQEQADRMRALAAAKKAAAK